MKDYLVGISEIEVKKQVARMGEIADILGVKGPSAYVMIKMLAERKLVKYEKSSYVNSTKKGREIADQLKLTNDLIKKYYVEYLGIDKETASKDAQRVRKVLSYSTTIKLKKYVDFLENRTNRKDINIGEEVNKISEK
jgi:DtxR family transcriptional regulator, Mn-dependent transcriptional regulator